ncbi:PaaX family transcriptional regulator C-terminal domain-containing protein [Streptomyces sp. CAU 1734]|uniref:PaaX family transcriptional regulator n=1 Tax=Streptomyces sp. CAU 1734 TaxID=3140360 RepID=UPI0032601EB0
MAEQRTPSSMIVTLCGTYGHARPGPLSVAELIRLLSPLGVDPPSVRPAVSRLRSRGVLTAGQAADGGAGYELSAETLQSLADGDRRVHARRAPLLSEGWVLALFSAPGAERHERQLLRSRLHRLGFGTVAPGVWIAPARLYEETRHTLRRRRLDPYAELFRGEHLGFAATAEAVAGWWDLTVLAKAHEEFLGVHEPVLRSWPKGREADPVDAYRDYLYALDAWRRLVYTDPGLPLELLPEGWPGIRSAEVFATLHELLRDAGAVFAGAACGTGR